QREMKNLMAKQITEAPDEDSMQEEEKDTSINKMNKHTKDATGVAQSETQENEDGQVVKRKGQVSVKNVKHNVVGEITVHDNGAAQSETTQENGDGQVKGKGRRPKMPAILNPLYKDHQTVHPESRAEGCTEEVSILQTTTL
ncbi:hypothetical protein PFISCL1PPCAC_16534, partial [Pristionchus fissidentatus]